MQNLILNYVGVYDLGIGARNALHTVRNGHASKSISVTTVFLWWRGSVLSIFQTDFFYLLRVEFSLIFIIGLPNGEKCCQGNAVLWLLNMHETLVKHRCGIREKEALTDSDKLSQVFSTLTTHKGEVLPKHWFTDEYCYNVEIVHYTLFIYLSKHAKENLWDFFTCKSLRFFILGQYIFSCNGSNTPSYKSCQAR